MVAMACHIWQVNADALYTWESMQAMARLAVAIFVIDITHEEPTWKL